MASDRDLFANFERLRREMDELFGDALDRGLAGPIHPAASAFCKHPPRQVPDDQAHADLELFVTG